MKHLTTNISSLPQAVFSYRKLLFVFISLACVALLFLFILDSYKDTYEEYSDKTKFMDRISRPPQEWDFFEKILNSLWVPIAIYRTSPRKEILPILEQAPKVSQDIQGIITLFRWFISKKWNDSAQSFRPLINASPDPDTIFCGEAVKMFRTFLDAQGFISRTVTFEFYDGHGGGSHTLMEVFDPSQKKWLYFDPHYYVYSDSYSVQDVLSNSDPLTLEPIPGDARNGENEESRKFSLGALFNDGWHLWYVSNGVGHRIQYKNPEFYQHASSNENLSLLHQLQVGVSRLLNTEEFSAVYK
ncbi:MAG: hypothetical protein HQM14_16395 [SAR324 cluster bacterium]|nr:hypothetical protein [SAR324 cluster bacterium]